MYFLPRTMFSHFPENFFKCQLPSHLCPRLLRCPDPGFLLSARREWPETFVYAEAGVSKLPTLNRAPSGAPLLGPYKDATAGAWGALAWPCFMAQSNTPSLLRTAERTGWGNPPHSILTETEAAGRRELWNAISMHWNSASTPVSARLQEFTHHLQYTWEASRSSCDWPSRACNKGNWALLTYKIRAQWTWTWRFSILTPHLRKEKTERQWSYLDKATQLRGRGFGIRIQKVQL